MTDFDNFLTRDYVKLLRVVDQALCAEIDPDIWYPEPGATVKFQKEICGKCPIASECLEFAMNTNENYGIWGGLTPRERMKLRSPQLES